MRLLVLFFSLICSQAFSSDLNSYSAMKLKFSQTASMANSLNDFSGAWTPNQLSVGTLESEMVVLGHIDPITGKNIFHGVLDGVKFYNQMFISSNEVQFWMDSLLYNIFDASSRVQLENATAVHENYTLDSSWSDRIDNSDFKNVYQVSKHDRKNFRNTFAKAKAHFQQTCKLISADKMICQQAVSNCDGTRVEALDRYLVFDRM